MEKLTKDVSKLKISKKETKEEAKPVTKQSTPTLSLSTKPKKIAARKRNIIDLIDSSSSDSTTEDDTTSEQQSDSEASSVEKLSRKIKEFKLPKQTKPIVKEPEPVKKPKINPFAGGLSNSSFIKKKEDDSLDTSQIFKNKQNIETILKFLSDFKQNTVKGIILRGGIGCGKMTLIKACLKKAGYSNIFYDADSESDDIFENLLLSVETKGFNKLLQQKGNLKKAIIIRDVDGALKSSQKTEFFKFLGSSKKSLPVLMTSTDRSVGTAREVPRHILQLDFETPSVAELIRHFGNDKISKSALEKIISDSKFDIRYIKSVVDGLEYSKGKINIKKVANFSKDIELDTFNCIRFCADPKNTWDTKLTHTSLYTNSTVFHNYPKIVDGIRGEPEDMEICSKVVDMCCASDAFIQYSFANQDWDSLEECYNTLGTIGPLELISRSDIEIGELTYPSSNLTVHKDDNLDFREVEKESMMIMIVLNKYYNANKFVGNPDDFKKDMKLFRYPIQAYKLANMTTDPKKINAFLRDFKKRIASSGD